MCKKVAVFVILLIGVTFVAVGANNIFSAEEADKEMLGDVKSFIAYYPQPYQFEELVENPMDADKINEFTTCNETPAIDTESGEIIGIKELIGAEFNNDNLSLLSEPTQMSKFLETKGIIDAQVIKFINVGSYLQGYVVYVKCIDAVNFIPLLRRGNEFAGFKNKQIYTSEEFAQLCEQQECKFIVFGDIVDSDKKPTMQYGTTMLPLRSFLEAIGMMVGWDSNDNCVTFGSYKFSIDKNLNPNGLMQKDGNDIGGGNFEVTDGRVMVDDMFISEFEKEFNVWIRRDIGNLAIDVIAKE